jgi:hypothetical protein
MYSAKRRFRLFRHPAWASGPPVGSSKDILTFSRSLATTFMGNDVVPTDGGALTINSQPVGNYEYTTRKGSTTISSFTASDWFTNTKDTTSSWIVVNGNLTINAGQILTPPVRKLFTVLYVTGNLICNGSISMTARGANHSGTGDSGGATSAVDIRVGTGTFSAITNPQIPAAGGTQGVAVNASNNGNSGGTGINGGTGGGGSGQAFSSGRSGAGAAGTCFSGGGGGGGILGGVTAGSAVANGGAGGAAAGSVSGGGAGNPGGAGTGGQFGPNGDSGTGGTLIVIVEGTLSGTGTIVSNGSSGGGVGGQVWGGSSGGGSVNVLYGTDSSSITPAATGGSSSQGGPGGNGTARKLAIGAN